MFLALRPRPAQKLFGEHISAPLHAPSSLPPVAEPCGLAGRPSARVDTNTAVPSARADAQFLPATPFQSPRHRLDINRDINLKKKSQRGMGRPRPATLSTIMDVNFLRRQALYSNVSSCAHSYRLVACACCPALLDRRRWARSTLHVLGVTVGRRQARLVLERRQGAHATAGTSEQILAFAYFTFHSLSQGTTWTR